jgi:hypothetical protein
MEQETPNWIKESIQKLGEKEVLKVPANASVIAITHESVNLPPDLVGRLSLKMNILILGLTMGSQSQIDAGYKGKLMVLLYNLSSKPVFIRHKAPILRIEFSKLTQKTLKPYNDRFMGAQQLKFLLGAEPMAATSLSSLHKAMGSMEGKISSTKKDLATKGDELKKDIDAKSEELRKNIDAKGEELKKANSKLNWIAGLAAVLPIILGLVQYFGPITNKLSEIEKNVAVRKAADEASKSSLIDRLNKLEKISESKIDLNKFEKELKELRDKITELEAGK